MKRATYSNPSPGPCGPYSYSANTWSNGSNTYVDTNMWNPIPGVSETLTAYNPGNFTVSANFPLGNTAVVSYSNTEQKPPCCSEPLLDSFNSITASFSESMPHLAGVSAWAAFDNWFNNWADEVMIQNDFVGNGRCTYRAVAQFGGSKGVTASTWGLCVFGSELIWKLAPSSTVVGSSATINDPTMTVDVLAMTQWLETHGYLPANTTITDTSYGWEICSTAGLTAPFTVSAYSITAS